MPVEYRGDTVSGIEEMIPLEELREFEAPAIEWEMTTKRRLGAPQGCAPVLHQLAYIFIGRSVDAPKLWIAGGLLHDNTPVSGAGADDAGAMVRLTGEAAEQLSLRRRPPRAPSVLPLHLEAHGRSDVEAPTLVAKCWRSGRSVRVPGSLLPHGEGHGGYSEGLGSHTDPDQALRHGVFELIEREAVRRWWSGTVDAARVLDGAHLIADELGAPRLRKTLLLHVANANNVPVMIAASFDADGGSFCFGAAASETARSAARAALRELGATEFGLSLARLQSQNDTADKSNDLLLAERVDFDTFVKHHVACSIELNDVDRSIDLSSLENRDAFLSKLDIYSIELPTVAAGFKVVKAVSDLLKRENSKYTGGKVHGIFGVPIY